jgi:hypothetical protein
MSRLLAAAVALILFHPWYLLAEEADAGKANPPETKAAEEPAKAPADAEKPAEAPPKLKIKPYLGYISAKPLDIISRFFKLTDEQTKQKNDLTAKYLSERNERMNKIEEELSAKFGDLAQALLTDEQKAEYAKVQQVIADHEKARKAAQDEFGKVYQEAIGSPMVYFPNAVDQLLWNFPTLSMEEKQKASKAAMEIRKGSNQEIEAILKEAGIARPTDHKDREGWQRYSEAWAPAQREVSAKHNGEVVQAIGGVLAPDMKAKFDQLAGAFEKARKTSEEAMGKLTEQLEAIVGSERLKPQYPQYQGMMAPPGGQPAPRKPEKDAKAEGKVF